MKINEIELYNFGSYEGLCSFDFSSENPEKRIIIIGGKNGAGKTTLFTAIQLCLYGNYAFGYKNAGRQYHKKIYKLINVNARLKKDETSHLRIAFQHNNARDIEDFEITREWSWVSGEIEETLTVTQNGEELIDEDLLAFQNYLLYLIPPDLLNLYFFDGEKIADFFLGDNEANIREALMILSGNDTFDILHDNVRRVLNRNKDDGANEIASEYLSIQEDLETDRKNVSELQQERENLLSDLGGLETDLEQLTAQYSDKGGITYDQLSELQLTLKMEEEKREKINGQRKAIATDVLPFIIMKDLVGKVQPQIDREEAFSVYQSLEEKISGESFREALFSALGKAGVTSIIDESEVYSRIKENLLSGNWTGFSSLFQLSSDEKIQVYSVLNRIAEYDDHTLKDLQCQLEESLAKSKVTRTQIQNSDTEHVEDYIRTSTQMEGEIKLIQSKIEQMDTDILYANEQLEMREKRLESIRKEFEESLKKESVSSISGRLLLMLEELQNNVYTELVSLVEKDLKFKLKQLIRNPEFFDDVIIDMDFNVHIVKNQAVLVEDLVQIVEKGGVSSLQRNIGKVAVEKIIEDPANVSNGDLISRLRSFPGNEIVLPLEINKGNMSSGEKQIFVMSLYWALMQRSDSELPYVIDTPFARIDTEHRANITKYFFSDLPGQLVILSTNEELDGGHLQIMRENISHVYLLECNEEKHTDIYKDIYFEV